MTRTELAPRTLGPLEVDGVFTPGRFDGPVRATKEHPLTGDLWIDARGDYYLSPHADYRGSNQDAVAVVGLTAHQRTAYVGREVMIAGTFVPGRGFAVEDIGPAGGAFDPGEPHTKDVWGGNSTSGEA
jgi:hypothetical protein